MLLGAITETVTNRPWDRLIRERILKPLGTTHSHTDHDSGQRDNMTRTHRMWFGVPVAQTVHLPRRFAPAGGLVASANDMALYLQMLPDARQAVLVLVNANSVMPFGRVNAVLSRLPIGIVNLLQGQPPPTGPSLRSAYRIFNIGSTLAIALSLGLAWRVSRFRHRWAPPVLATLAVGVILGLMVFGISPALLAASVPDLALVLAVVSTLLCLPLLLRIGGWIRDSHWSRTTP